MSDRLSKNGRHDSVVMDKAIFGDDFEGEMTLTVEFGLETLGESRSQNRVHDLRFGDSFKGNISFVAAAAINIVGGRWEID